jgi:hypothetical protein
MTPHPTEQERKEMNARDVRDQMPAGSPGCEVAEVTIPQLVGYVYESAPAAERKRLLEYLMQPLGVLSLAVVANGIFSKIRFRGGWPDLNIRPEDLSFVRVGDVIDLVDHVQQASVDAIDGLVSLLSTSPMVAGSAAAALLVAVLVQQSRARSDAFAGAHEPLAS